jgi:hypothetical protein
MAKQALARTVDLEPIDRLEEKIGLLVSMITQLRAEQAQALDANARSQRRSSSFTGSSPTPSRSTPSWRAP